MRFALAQLNPTVGDIDANAGRVVDAIGRAVRAGADVVVFPELVVTGYPPRDLVLRRDFVDRNVAAVRRIASRCTGVTAMLGFVQPDPTGQGRGVQNAAAVCSDGRIEATYAKALLPTYDIFDECRYFNAGQGPLVLPVRGASGERSIGVTICEDLWNNQQFEGRRVYGFDPIAGTVEAGADLLVNLSASPFREGVERERERLFAGQIRQLGVPLVYVNQIGGNDELLFDGASMVLGERGEVLARAKAFAEDFLIFDLAVPGDSRIEAYPQDVGQVRMALVLGIRDYMRKCGFTDAVIGLSGGIDSAVTAALAVEAVGKERVHGVAMPSRYSSPHSLADAKGLGGSLGITLQVIPIGDIHDAFESTLRPVFSNLPPDVAEENIQSRIRGNLLMALSNKFGWLLLTTGNKSELAVGFCTLYGDMCGGLAALSDVPKTTVYELARHINETAGREVIPQRTIDKPPSAELRPDQLDVDTIPPYEVLDPILEQYIEQERSVDEIIAAAGKAAADPGSPSGTRPSQAADRATVERVVRMVHASEYKRKQTPVGLKVTSRAFGTGRRMPIAARYF